MAPSAHIPFETHGEDRHSEWLITCDHATNIVPDEIGGGSLGLPHADMERHIAYDVGAAGVSRALADLLDAPAILSRFSRLVIDPNRGELDPTLVMQLYDGSIIPENRGISQAEIDRRKRAYYAPYHAKLAEIAAALPAPTILAVHSFTPQLKKGPPRPWHIGILYDERAPEFSRALLACLRKIPDLCVGENEPYAGHLPGDSLDRHANTHGLDHCVIELRNDLIETPEQQQKWAEILAPALQEAYVTRNAERA